MEINTFLSYSKEHKSRYKLNFLEITYKEDTTELKFISKNSSADQIFSLRSKQNVLPCPVKWISQRCERSHKTHIKVLYVGKRCPEFIKKDDYSPFVVEIHSSPDFESIPRGFKSPDFVFYNKEDVMMKKKIDTLKLKKKKPLIFTKDFSRNHIKIFKESKKRYVERVPEYLLACQTSNKRFYEFYFHQKGTYNYKIFNNTFIFNVENEITSRKKNATKETETPVKNSRSRVSFDVTPLSNHLCLPNIYFPIIEFGKIKIDPKEDWMHYLNWHEPKIQNDDLKFPKEDWKLYLNWDKFKIQNGDLKTQ